jgi:hypothetical protein
LDARKPDFVGGLIENLGAREYAMWDALTEALRTGQSQTEVPSGSSCEPEASIAGVSDNAISSRYENPAGS